MEQGTQESQNASPAGLAQEKKDALKRQAAREDDPVSGLTGKQLAVGYWWVEHRLLLRRLGLSLLGAVCAVLVGYSVWAWTAYFTYGIWKDRAMLEDMSAQTIPFAAYHQARAPRAPESGSVTVLASGTNEKWRDIVTAVTNPNEKWIADLSFYFEEAGDKTPLQQAVLLPGTEHYVGALGFAPTSTLRNPLFVIERLLWRRVDPHLVPDVAAFIASRRDFSVADLILLGPGDEEGLDTHKISFTITNNTIHSFWTVPFWVLLYQNDRLVGVERLVLDAFERSENRLVDVRSSVPNRSVTRAVIVPDIDVFDRANYMPLAQEFVPLTTLPER